MMLFGGLIGWPGRAWQAAPIRTAPRRAACCMLPIPVDANNVIHSAPYIQELLKRDLPSGVSLSPEAICILQRCFFFPLVLFAILLPFSSSVRQVSCHFQNLSPDQTHFGCRFCISFFSFLVLIYFPQNWNLCGRTHYQGNNTRNGTFWGQFWTLLRNDN